MTLFKVEVFANKFQILDSDDPEECLPLYLRPNDPMCVPILSHNSPTNNVLLQITVPRRTGRKRKRGSQDPYAHAEDTLSSHSSSHLDLQNQRIRSLGRGDHPAELRRSLLDNVGKYKVEAVAEIKQTHRYRGET